MNSNRPGEVFFQIPIDVDSLTAEGRAKLGPFIKQRRESLGMTKLQLSFAAGVDRKTLGTIESGQRAGQADKLRALLEALSVTQVGDADRRYSDETRSFIASTAPIFDQLPSHVQAEAQNDVVVLLAGKLARSANVPTSYEDLPMAPPRTLDLNEMAADERDETELDTPAPGEHPED